MTDYFRSVGSKSSLLGTGVFNYEDSKPELLLDYYNKHHQLSESDCATIQQIFRRWCILLSTGFNIVAHGPQSKFAVIETFYSQYLKTGRIRRFQMEELVVVRLHGFTPITWEKFTHALFKKVDSSKFDEKELHIFLEKAEKTQTHYIFLLHSIELLHAECRRIIENIFKLCEMKPNLIHIVMSVDHVNHGKIITNSVKQRLRLNYFLLPNVSSYFYEKTHSVQVIYDGKDAKRTNKIYEDQLSLQSLKDFYQATQKNSQMLMLHIIKTFYERTISNSENNRPLGERRSQRGKSSSSDPTVYSFEELFKYCDNNYIARRMELLRGYLKELDDHGIVSLDSSCSKIQCQVNFETCKKFLSYSGAL